MKLPIIVVTVIILSVTGAICISHIQQLQTPQCKFVNEFIENGHAGTLYEEYKRHGANYTVTVMGFPALPDDI